MDIESLIAACCVPAIATGRVDPEAAQNSMNRVAARLGIIGRSFDLWFRCGKSTQHILPGQAADLACEAIGLLVNIVGFERTVELLERRSRRNG